MPTVIALLWLLQGAPPVVSPTQAAADEQLFRAEARLRAAIAISPTISAYHESLALMLEREGRNEDALATHREAVRLDSTSARNRAGLGALLAKLGRSAEAIPHLRAASEMDRSSVEIRKVLAAALREQSRDDEAVVTLREARVLDSTDTSIDSALAQSQARDEVDGYHDYSGFADDHVANRTVHRVMQWVFAAILGACALVLLAPLVGGLLLGVLAVRNAARPETAS